MSHFRNFRSVYRTDGDIVRQRLETFEKKPDEFQQKVNSAYPKIAKDFNLTMIDASGTIEEVFDLILGKL